MDKLFGVENKNIFVTLDTSILAVAARAYFDVVVHSSGTTNLN